jgi:hypothetical protein
MAINVNEFVLAHELDAAWLIALWKAIHGGDPSPEVVAGQIIASLAPYTTKSAESFTLKQLESGLQQIGVQVTEKSLQESRSDNRPHQYCFQVNGRTICIELKRPQFQAQAGAGG